MIAVLAATAALLSPWHSHVWAERAVVADEDPGRITAVQCDPRGRHKPGEPLLYRRWACGAAGPNGCLYFFRVRVTTTKPNLHYSGQDEWCAGRN